VAQLFAWFDSISKNPRVAFPALLQSFGYRPEQIFGVAGQQQQPQQPGAQLPPELMQRLGKIDEFEQRFASMGEAQAHAVLNEFKKDKPYFEQVRAAMARLISNGSIPFTADGAIDLQGAYDAACHLDPAIREQIFNDRLGRERRNASDAAARARRAGVSLPPGSPGRSTSNGAGRKAAKGTSVRESIARAIEESLS
jgi:hypothetical protein